MTTPIQGLKATSVHVKDIAKARTFYTKSLGLKELGFDPTNKAAYFEVPGSPAALAIHEYTDACRSSGGRPPGTVSGTIFTVANVEQAAEQLKGNGVTITGPPGKTPFGVLATIADPDGNEFIISQK